MKWSVWLKLNKPLNPYSGRERRHQIVTQCGCYCRSVGVHNLRGVGSGLESN